MRTARSKLASRTRRILVALVALVAFALQALVTGPSVAQSSGSDSASDDNNPLNPDVILKEIEPHPGALFPIGIPQSWFDFKDDVGDKYGFKFGFSYPFD